MRHQPSCLDSLRHQNPLGAVMAYLDGTARYRTEVGSGRPRINLVSGLLLLVASLASPVVAAANDPYPASISPPPSYLDLPTTLVVDDRPRPTSVAQWAMHRHPQHELRHIRAKRQDDEDEDKDEERSTRTAPDRTTSTSDDKRETETSNKDENENEEEDDDDDQDSFTTFTVSLRPSPTATEDPEDSPLPSAFDGTPSSEFQGQDEDDSCPSFLNSILSNQTYLDCYPLSMMFFVGNPFLPHK